MRKLTTAALVALLLAPLALGCDSQLATVVEPEVTVETEAPRRFSWVIDEQLAGMAYPGSGHRALESYDYLNSQDVSLLVSLTEHLPVTDGLEERGIHHTHLPVVDFTAPSLEQLETFVTMTASELWFGGRVTVHCAGGRGRTGTFLAA